MAFPSEGEEVKRFSGYIPLWERATPADQVLTWHQCVRVTPPKTSQCCFHNCFLSVCEEKESPRGNGRKVFAVSYVTHYLLLSSKVIFELDLFLCAKMPFCHIHCYITFLTLTGNCPFWKWRTAQFDPSYKLPVKPVEFNVRSLWRQLGLYSSANPPCPTFLKILPTDNILWFASELSMLEVQIKHHLTREVPFKSIRNCSFSLQMPH